MQRSLTTVLASLAVVALAISGCGKKSEETSPAAAKERAKVRVAFVTNNPSDFWTIAKAGTKKAAEEFGAVVEFRVPAQGTAAEQQQIVEDLIVRGVSGIAISPKDPKNQTEMLNRAAEKVNLITQDSDAPESKRLCYIGTNNYDAGRAAGKLIKEVLPNGGKIMVFGSPKQRNLQEGWSREETWKRMVKSFQACMPAAEKNGVTICIEPLARTETNFINTAEEGMQLVRDVGHPNFRLMLDVKAMSDESKPYAEIIESAKECLVHFHANDANLRGPGFGDVDYAPIVEALRKIGYDGYLSVEVFDFSPDPETIARDSLSYLRKSFA